MISSSKKPTLSIKEGSNKPMDDYVWWWWFRRLDRKLNEVLSGEHNLMAALDDLTVQVQKNNDVEESAVILIQGIAKQLADCIASGNPAALVDLQTKLATSAADLAAAIAANTPAA